VRSQVQREGFDAFAPRSVPVGEDVVVDFPEQPLDEGLDHDGLSGKYV